MKKAKSCSNCLKGTAILVNNDILCRDNGAVSPDYVCSKHRYIPESKPYKEMHSKCISCEHFVTADSHSKDISVMGYCQLFTVRHFDGMNKKACSKFTRKTRLEVG